MSSALFGQSAPPREVKEESARNDRAFVPVN
jgi:hypothetical protein